MEVRILTAEDLEHASYLLSLAFSRGVEINIPTERWMNPNRARLGISEEGRLRSVLSIFDYELIFGDTRISGGGIAGVAVEPAYRGRGHAGKLLRAALEKMNDSGQSLSILWPFNHKFYQEYGWDVTGALNTYTIPVRLLPSTNESRNVRSLNSDLKLTATLNPIYEAKARNFNGALTREEWQWDAVTNPTDGRVRTTLVYSGESGDEGYAIFSFADDRTVGVVDEFVALTGDAYLGLLGTLHNFAMTVETLKIQCADNDPIWSFVVDHGVKCARTPSGMGRIVNVAKALEQRTADKNHNGEVVLKVSDNKAPWNNGNWETSVRKGKISVQTSERTAGVELDINALSQAYWGSPSLSVLRSIGRVRVTDEQQWNTFTAILPASNVWLYDDF